MITVQILGHGSYTISNEKVNELLTWLQSNSIPVESSSPPVMKPGDVLLSENNRHD